MFSVEYQVDNVIKFYLPFKSEMKECLIDFNDAHLILGLGFTVKESNKGSTALHLRSNRTERFPSQYIQRIIMNPSSNQVVDHINGNGLDNRRCNLRICTPQENNMNRRQSKGHGGTYRGVRRNKLGNYYVSMNHKNKKYYLGCFHHEIEAALAYDKAAREMKGQFARLNFPAPGEQSALVPSGASA